MPAKNIIKTFVANGYYHIYNRGVEKRIIFQDDQDYAVLLSYLKTYLLPKDTNSLQQTLANPDTSPQQKDQAIKLLRMNNFADTITLLSYCLMPDHFHYLIKQTTADAIDKFMNSLCTRYSMYFNKKYQRVGKLFQGIYKAVLVETDEQLLHLSRYIHRNPIAKGSALRTQGTALHHLTSYPYSSYSQYLGKIHRDWVKPQEILAFFSNQFPQSLYQYFVEHYQLENPTIDSLLLDDD